MRFEMSRMLRNFLLGFVALWLLVACQEKVDVSNRYVFTMKTVMSYLEKYDQYSEYVKLLKKTPVSKMSETTLAQLLSARGHYTVFAPTNDAIQDYLDSLYTKGLISEPSWDGFGNEHIRDSIEKVIVYNSIIDGGDNNTYAVSEFPVKQDAEIPTPNMYDRRLTVHQPAMGEQYLINDMQMDERNFDILLTNGVIHAMKQVVAPTNNTLGLWLADMINGRQGNYLVTAKLINAIGLIDSLKQWEDVAYRDLYERGEIPTVHDEAINSNNVFHTPQHRYYGYTLFAETDSVWESLLGKTAREISVQDVVDYLVANNIYPDAVNNTDYENENNLLNRFVTYHILPERLATDRLVMHWTELGYNKSTKDLGAAMSEFYTTMGKRRLMKLYESRVTNGIYLNRFPNIDNGRQGTYREVSCDADKEGIKVGEPDLTGDNNVRNAIVYPIDKLLLYDDATRDNLQKGRIRWDVASMFPEFINNDIRMCPLTDYEHTNVWIPSDKTYRYLDGVDISEETKFYYWTGMNQNWENYLGDEFTLRGYPDVTFRLPPVPRRGTYEFRYQVQSNGGMRGIVQFYWGKDKNKLAVMGIPLDLRVVANVRISSRGNTPCDYGWEKDTDDDDYNAEVDKHLRNNGYMKTPAIFSKRNSQYSTRRILFRQTMDPDEVYYIRFRSVMDDPTRYFYIDFFEYCAKEVYDNPESPEDIW